MAKVNGQNIFVPFTKAIKKSCCGGTKRPRLFIFVIFVRTVSLKSIVTFYFDKRKLFCSKLQHKSFTTGIIINSAPSAIMEIAYEFTYQTYQTGLCAL